MAWQTPNVVQNGPEKEPLHQQNSKEKQGLSGPWRFCIAPMMDWTDQK